MIPTIHSFRSCSAALVFRIAFYPHLAEFMKPMDRSGVEEGWDPQ
jgi:hypothetical protein